MAIRTCGMKTEMDPTPDQVEFLSTCCAAQRVTYNWGLWRCNEDYESKKRELSTALAGLLEDPESAACGSVVERLSILKGKSVLETAKALAEYPQALEKWKSEGRDRKTRPKRPQLKIRRISFNDVKKEWRAIYRDPRTGFEWMWCVQSTVIDSAFANLFAAFQRFYRYNKLPADARMGMPKVGYPKFKKRRANSSFSVIQQGTNGGIDVEESRIRLPNIGWIDLKEHGYLPIGKTQRTVTVFSAGGRWFVSVIGEREVEELPAGRPAVGIDVGIVHYAILQPESGPVERVENPAYLEKQLRRLRILSKHLSRKKGPKPGEKPSNNWVKLKEKINRLQWRIACKRKTFQHQLSHEIVSKYGKVSVERLGIQDMMRKGRSSRELRRGIGDAAWYEFRRQLTYKGEWRGTEVVAVDRWYPSTQECSKCKTTTQVNWSTRKCRCPKCGLVVDMDDNAAMNLLKQMKRLEMSAV